jgi:heme exporter protein D
MFFRNAVRIYHRTRHHMPDRSLNIRCCENLKSHTSSLFRILKIQLSDLQFPALKGMYFQTWPNSLNHGHPFFVLWPFKGLNFVSVMYVILRSLPAKKSVHLRAAKVRAWQPSWGCHMQMTWQYSRNRQHVYKNGLRKFIFQRLIYYVPYCDDNLSLFITGSSTGQVISRSNVWLI